MTLGTTSGGELTQSPGLSTTLRRSPDYTTRRKRIIVVFDEASNIADLVWEVAEGALTDEDTEIIWVAFGNPTRNTGRFRECFRKYKHRWKTAQIDSRTVEGTNKQQLQKWVDDYGKIATSLKSVCAAYSLMHLNCSLSLPVLLTRQ